MVRGKFPLFFTVPSNPQAVGALLRAKRANPGHRCHLRNAMTDTRSAEQRRRIMQAVQTAHTKPEMIVRKMLHAHGYRYRLHPKNLPGKPDIVFPSRRKALLIHGCFWHGHGCSKGQLPKSRLEYWAPKIEQNQKRDVKNSAALRHQGCDVAVVWECELRNPDDVMRRLADSLGPSRKSIDFTS